MNKKVLIIFLIVFGGYLAIGNTIFSMIFNYAGPIGYYVPMSPEQYWMSWWVQYGALTLLIAGIGILLLVFGIRILIKDKQDTSKNVIVAMQV